MRRDLRFLDPLHTGRAFLHYSAHPNGHVRIFLHLGDVGRTFFGEGRDVLEINSELSGDLLLPKRPLVVIEEIKPAHFEWTVVRAIPRPDATIVRHHVQSVLAVDRRVDWANRLTRSVLAVLAHHWLVHHFRIFRKLAVVFVERFR